MVGGVRGIRAFTDRDFGALSVADKAFGVCVAFDSRRCFYVAGIRTIGGIRRFFYFEDYWYSFFRGMWFTVVRFVTGDEFGYWASDLAERDFMVTTEL